MNNLTVNWTKFKEFVEDRALSIQHVSIDDVYFLTALDGGFQLNCSLTIDSSDDTIDFETNFKPNGNKSPKSEVISQTEKNDKTLKLVKATTTTDSTGYGELLIKVPGTFNGVDGFSTTPCNGRYIERGEVIFTAGQFGDYVKSIQVVDIDNILGYGANTVIGSYSDDEQPEQHRGWYLHPGIPTEVDAATGPGFLPSGVYISLKVQAINNRQDTLYVNLKWSKND